MNLSQYVAQDGMSQQKTADILGVTQSAVSQWIQWEEDNDRGTRITAERALAIEKCTGGLVTRYELRPDIYGPAPGVDPPIPAGGPVSDSCTAL